MLRLVLHRKTHDSRMFKLPLIHLPGIVAQEKFLDHNPAETYLYERMEEFLIEMLNGKTQVPAKELTGEQKLIFCKAWSETRASRSSAFSPCS